MISVHLFIALTIFSFIMGYCVGRLNSIVALLNKGHSSEPSAPQGFFAKVEAEKKEKISIDERTFVTKVDVESYDKKFSELGKKTVSEDNLNASVSKLAQLKKK